mgnify:CR=1 FL=1
MRYTQYFKNIENAKKEARLLEKSNDDLLILSEKYIFNCACGSSSAVQLVNVKTIVDDHIFVNCESCLNLYGDGIFDD